MEGCRPPAFVGPAVDAYKACGKVTRMGGATAQAQAKPCLASGRERTRLPVAEKMALHTAGSTGGRAGPPRPVGGLSVLRKWTSMVGGTCFMRTGSYSWKLLCTTRPLSMVIS